LILGNRGKHEALGSVNARWTLHGNLNKPSYTATLQLENFVFFECCKLYIKWDVIKRLKEKQLEFDFYTIF
jgi:hypothetical protein